MIFVGGGAEIAADGFDPVAAEQKLAAFEIPQLGIERDQPAAPDQPHASWEAFPIPKAAGGRSHCTTASLCKEDRRAPSHAPGLAYACWPVFRTQWPDFEFVSGLVLIMRGIHPAWNEQMTPRRTTRARAIELRQAGTDDHARGKRSAMSRPGAVEIALVSPSGHLATARVRSRGRRERHRRQRGGAMPRSASCRPTPGF